MNAGPFPAERTEIGSDYYSRDKSEAPRNSTTLDGVIEYQATLISALYDSFNALERRLAFVLVSTPTEAQQDMNAYAPTVPSDPDISPATRKVDDHNTQIDLLGRSLVNLRQRLNLD